MGGIVEILSHFFCIKFGKSKKRYIFNTNGRGLYAKNKLKIIQLKFGN